MQPRMARTITLVALGIALGGLAAPLGAQQSATTGAFRGRVADEEGRPIAGAQVVARNEATGLERSALADEDGRFLLPLIPPGGPYTLRATSVGYRGIAQSGYNVGVGDVVSVTLELPVQAVEVAALEVTAAPARIDVTQGGVVQRVGPDEVENLPVNGRDFTDFLNLSPLVSPHPETGTGGQFAVGGARASATNVQIDGADANNLFFGENRGSSRTPFAFSLESIKEFQLITNGFDVEHGNYLGGVMNAVTKGGTNEFRGSLFYLQRDEALTANDFLNQDPRDFTSKQFGLNVSGPAVRDKLHYFLSVDVQRKTQPIFAATPASTGAKPDSINKFLQILEQKYGVPSPGRFYGEKEQEENNLVLFGRVDWNLGRSHRLTVRQNYSSFEQTNDRIGATEAITNGGPFRDTVFSTVAELNSVLGGRAFNTLRFQWSDEVRPRPANPDGGYVPQVSVAIDGFRRIVFGGDGIIFRNRLKEKKLQFVDNFTIRSGAHTFKLGTNNLISTTENEFWLLGTGSYTFNSLKDFAEGRPANYFRLTRKCAVPLEANALGEKVYCPQYDVPFAEFQALEWSAYAQDDWQVNERLQLTAGVRYGGTSFQDQPGKVAALETAFGVRADVVPDFSGISPRLSFTYDLSGDQARLLRGGVGLLVGRAPTVIAGNVFQTERALLSVFCAGATAPTMNMAEFLSVPRGERNPLACKSGADPTGLPEHSVFSDDFELPRTLKANLGYEHLFGRGTKLRLDLLFSNTTSNFNVVDLNLRDPVLNLAAEKGRPVFLPANRYNPRSAGGNDRLRNNAFARIFQNQSEAEARAYNITVELDRRVSDKLQFSARYGWNHAFDNSSYSCCTAGEGLTGGGSSPPVPTAASPNFIGDPGDDEVGSWGPSGFERRHIVTANAVWNAPWGFRVSGIWRSQSGTPWTPVVDGDVNADGALFNDRAMISPNLQFRTPADKALFNKLTAKFECLFEQIGRIAARNSCRNPWFHSLDLRIAKGFTTISGQRAELLVDAFNVLNGMHRDWGRWMGTFSSRTNLLRAESYNATTKNVVYSVNSAFGETQPVGFDPFQFQLQVGVRYHF